VERREGDGSTTLFWHDRWLGDTPLCGRFDRLFGLALNKLSTVADMFTLGWDVGGCVEMDETVVGVGGGVVRRVSPFTYSFVVQSDVIDRWRWILLKQKSF
jgi:hypothetical protein